MAFQTVFLEKRLDFRFEVDCERGREEQDSREDGSRESSEDGEGYDHARSVGRE
jgi:hypothetical protein